METVGSIIHVTGIDNTLTEDDLLHLFRSVGDILHLNYWNKGKFLPGFASLSYATEEEAKTAVELFDYKVFCNGVLRVRFPRADIRAHMTNTNGCPIVSITNINMQVSREDLRDLFEEIGEVDTFDVKEDEETFEQRDVKLGSGFVKFVKEEDAKLAIEELNQLWIDNVRIHADPYISERDRKEKEEEEEIEDLRRTVLVKNFSGGTYTIRSILGEIGDVVRATITGCEDEYSPECVCHVTFKKIDEAALAVQKMNGRNDGKMCWSVEWALTRSELDEKMRKYEVVRNSHIVVKNLNESIYDKHLWEMFSPFGEVTSWKVELDSQGKSTGTGYVKFSYAKDATSAVNKMNGKMITGDYKKKKGK